MARVILTFTVLSLLSTSCYYGATQSAHTLGKDHMALTMGLTLPAYFSSSSRIEAEESGIDNIEAYLTADAAIGATDNMDLGISTFGYGIGPMFKYNLMPHDNPTALSAAASMNYVIPMKVIMPRLSVCAGHRFDRELEIFAGADLGYGPDLANIPENEEGAHEWDEVDNTLFAGVRLGCRYELRPPGSTARGYLPESVLFQFSVPLDISRTMLLAGIAITY